MDNNRVDDTDLEAEESLEAFAQPSSPSSLPSDEKTQLLSATPTPPHPSPSPWRDRSSIMTELAHKYGRMEYRHVGQNEYRWFWVLDTHRGKPHPATTILFIHGIGGRVEHFLDQIVEMMERVEQGALRILAMDLMGHGRSPKPREAHHYHSDLFIADLEHIMSSSKSHTHIVMGHSLGAALATTLAVRSKFPIHRLILLGIPDLINAKKVSCGARVFQYMMRHCWERVLIALRPIISKAVIAAAYHPTTSRTLIAEEAACNGQNPFYVVRSVAEGAKLHAITPSSLSRITIPTLLLHGATDGVCSPQASRTLAEYIPNARLEIVDKTSHNLQIERPSEIFLIWHDFAFASDADIAQQQQSQQHQNIGTKKFR